MLKVTYKPNIQKCMKSSWEYNYIFNKQVNNSDKDGHHIVVLKVGRWKHFHDFLIILILQQKSEPAHIDCFLLIKKFEHVHDDWFCHGFLQIKDTDVNHDSKSPFGKLVKIFTIPFNLSISHQSNVLISLLRLSSHVTY